MSNTTTNFYSDLRGFRKFSEACNREHYHRAPDDWVIFVADVEGSTKAIESGRYKDVNMVGAASIAAAINSCKNIEIPYVFGGDGATILVPPHFKEAVKRELLSLKRLSKNMHDLRLRIGCVPVRTVREKGKDFLVAKYLTKMDCPLAMYRGGGALMADTLVKDHGYEFECEGHAPAPNLQGLSCRWRPIPSKHGNMLTMLILSTDSEESKQTYRRINNVLSNILGKGHNPVHTDNMTYSWPGFESMRQSQLVWRQGNKLKNAAGHIFMTGFFNVLNRYNISVGSFEPERYRQALMANSDYRKFDDMLRMVVDCSKQQARRIERRLAEWYEQNKIVYGTHYSSSALMTCFVVTTKDDEHVHFIDGNHGGYALAAKQLKHQLSVHRQKTPDTTESQSHCP